MTLILGLASLRLGATAGTVFSAMSEPLADLIASLPEEERVVLALHYVKGKSAAEIAALLGVPVRAVEGVLASGRARLSTALGLKFPPTPPSEG